VPPVRPVSTRVRPTDVVTELGASTEKASFAARVVAPDTAKDMIETTAVVLMLQVMDTSADVPVTSVTLGFVPGDPLNVVVYDAELV
jgi:hypothetical protein